MNTEQTLLKLLFGSAENEIHFVSGSNRAAVNALMAARGAKIAAEYLLRNPPAAADTLILINRLVSLAPHFRSNKYICYNGRVFVDCFAPGWPGKAMDKMFVSLLDGLLRGTDEWGTFIPSLVFSITKKCVYRCEHCYAIRTLGTSDVIAAEQLLKIARGFQKTGVGVIAWEGGEPLLRFEELLMLIRETRAESEALIATTGYGLTAEMAQRLREAGLDTAIISLDHYLPDRHNKFRRNKKAFDMAVNGVRTFRENGVLPSIAICATRELMDEDGLFHYMELAKEIGAAFVQILDATPSGNYLGRNVMLTAAQVKKIREFHVMMNTAPRYRDYPAVQARAFLEDENVYGCCAACALVYVDSSGNAQPCDLLQISFGNALEENPEDILRRMRKWFPHPTKGRCPAQTLHRDIAAVSEKTGQLPLRHEDCGPILEKIRRRGLPGRLKRKSKR